MTRRSITDWLPTTVKEMKSLGWDRPDVVLFSGDAYVDHPSFGPAVTGRLLESMGLRVAIVPQPNWQDDLRDFKKFGPPRLFFGVTSGCMDSMVNHYTANRRLRSDDAYSPGGKSGFRPDYATVVYTNILKDIFPDVPVVIGGVEASLRRFTHYDFWKNELLPGILYQCNADMLIYGMGEQPLKMLVDLLDKEIPFDQLKNIPQTVLMAGKDEHYEFDFEGDIIKLHAHELCVKNKKKFAQNFAIIEQESNYESGKYIIQEVGDKMIIVNPAFPVMDSQMLDQSFDLPYTRLPHPKYDKKGDIPAYQMIRHSINSHRGCFGACSFCTIAAHQGKFIASRSRESIMKEVNAIIGMPDFKGNISDIGGPSANMYGLSGKDMTVCRKCKRASCLYPALCNNLNTDHSKMVQLYRAVENDPGVKRVFLGSGIRYDLLMNEKGAFLGDDKETYFNQVLSNHVSGRLKVAPEHTSPKVLKIMRKPSYDLFRAFKRKFEEVNEKENLKQQLVPYFISSHPASKEEHMAELAAETKEDGFRLQQVQNFTPSPMTLATVMYYSGYNPYTLEPVFSARTDQERKNQNLFFFWYKKENKAKIIRRLKQIQRFDLIKRLFE